MFAHSRLPLSGCALHQLASNVHSSIFQKEAKRQTRILIPYLTDNFYLGGMDRCHIFPTPHFTDFSTNLTGTIQEKTGNILQLPKQAVLIIEGIFGLHPTFLEAFGNVSLFKAHVWRTERWATAWQNQGRRKGKMWGNRGK